MEQLATAPKPIETEAQSCYPPRLTTADVSKLTGLSPRTLQRMRASGEGPAFYCLGRRRVQYASDTVAAWMQGRLQPGG